MLAEAIRQDDVLEQVRWSKDLVSLDPNNRDVHFVLAAEGLDGSTPNIPEIRRHLKVLEGETPRRARTEWVAARLARLANDQPRLGEILKKARSLSLPADADPLDRMALLKLRAIDVASTDDIAALAGPIDALSRDAVAASSEPEIPSTRIAFRISSC